jgi:uncharacterized membrane protein (DUF485 family)
MDHGPVTEWKEDAKTSKIKSRIGIWMFLGYSIVYAIFIIFNVVNPKLMGMDIGMVNLAIVFGFGLIVLALIMAVIYNALCGSAEEKALKLEKLEKLEKKHGEKIYGEDDHK